MLGWIAYQVQIKLKLQPNDYLLQWRLTEFFNISTSINTKFSIVLEVLKFTPTPEATVYKHTKLLNQNNYAITGSYVLCIECLSNFLHIYKQLTLPGCQQKKATIELMHAVLTKIIKIPSVMHHKMSLRTKYSC